MTFTLPVASVVVGAVAILVAGWGTWLSVGSSRRGAGWAHAFLVTWRWMPWAIGAAGVVLALVAEPPWVGIAVAYTGFVTAILARSVRTRLSLARDTYGAFDPPSEAAISQSATMGTYLMWGGVVLAVIAVWDVTERGWAGAFGLALAAILALAGWLVRGRF